MKPGLSLWQVLREDDEDAKNKAEGKELGLSDGPSVRPSSGSRKPYKGERSLSYHTHKYIYDNHDRESERGV
jgi:hypothetical protein